MMRKKKEEEGKKGEEKEKKKEEEERRRKRKKRKKKKKTMMMMMMMKKKNEEEKEKEEKRKKNNFVCFDVLGGRTRLPVAGLVAKQPWRVRAAGRAGGAPHTATPARRHAVCPGPACTPPPPEPLDVAPAVCR